VAAVRETIFFAVVLGAIVLHERVSVTRFFGAVLVVTGVALAALG